MTFGETLRQILLYSGIKSGHLAEMLGYDPSYVSRWLNNEKLPSEKNNGDIFREIARCVLTNSDESTHRELTEKIGLSVASDAPLHVLSDVLADFLQSVYVNQKNTLEQKKEVEKVECNCIYLRHVDANIIKPLISSSIFELLQNNREQKIEIIDTIRRRSNSPDYLPYDECLADVSHGGNLIHVRRLLSYQDFFDHVDPCCRKICSTLRNSSEVLFDYFLTEDEELDQEDIILIKDKLSLRQLKEPLTNTKYLLCSKENSMVDDYYHVFDAALCNLRPIYERYSVNRFVESNHLFNFVMQGDYHYLLPVMYLLYIDRESCSQLWERYKFTGGENRKDGTIDLNTEYNMLSAKRTVTIFKTAILEYIFGGKIMYAGTMLYFTKEERIKHLNLLVEKLQSDESFKLNILEDMNPIICHSELEAAVFVSNKTAHASCCYTAGTCFRFTDARVISGFLTFLKDIENLPETYVMKGQQVIELLENGIKWMKQTGEKTE